MTDTIIPHVSLRTCSKCFANLPFTSFNKDKRLRDGLKYECRECCKQAGIQLRSSASWKARQQAEQLKPKDIPNVKQCSKCRKVKEARHFHRIRAAKNGLSSACKHCAREHSNRPDIQQAKRAHYEKIKRSVKNVPLTNKCADCKQVLPYTAFYQHKGVKKGIAAVCKQCKSAYYRTPEYRQRKKEWRANEDKEKVFQQTRQYNLKRKFQITPEEYAAMLRLQNGVCAICQLTCKKSLSVDHCHTTGKIRGLLCGQCNVILGRWRDNIECAERALEYLRNQGHFSAGGVGP